MHTKVRGKGMLKRTLTLITVLLLMAAWLPAYAAEAPEQGKDDTKQAKKWYDRIKFKGDARLRYEGFKKTDAFDDDRRDRFRTRIRAGFEATITEKMLFGLQIRNGDPDDPVSNNTSYDGAFQWKEWNLAQAFLSYDFNDTFSGIAGKFDAKKRWKVSDMQWDDDVTVEGVMANFEDIGKGDGAWQGLDLALFSYLLEEQSSASDSRLYGAQARFNIKANGENKFFIGAGYDIWDNPQAIADLTLEGDLGGNNMTNIVDEDGMLVSDFDILNIMAEWKNTASEKWPVKLNLFYYINTGADGLGADEDTAYFGRLQVGDYKKPWQVAFRYSYYYSEADALFYVFTQSDTSRGSDLEAHRLDFRLGGPAKSYFNLTYYNTNNNDGTDEDLHRWQLDYIVKF